MKLRLLRAMCFGGVRQEAGTVMDVADLLARELLSQGRAEAAGGAKAPASAGPMTTDTTAAVVKGKAAKEPANVSQ